MQTNLFSNCELFRAKGDEAAIIDSAPGREMIFISEACLDQVDLVVQSASVAFDRFSWELPKERVTWADRKVAGPDRNFSIQVLGVSGTTW